MISGLFNKSFIKSIALLMGTMVGVGVFGIPFAFSKSGFWIGFSFLIFVGVVTLIMSLLYGEIVLRTTERHQVVGYTKIYVGEWAKRIIFFSIVLSTYAALLAYIIIAGEFWATVFSPISSLPIYDYSFWFFVVASLLVLAGLKAVSWVEVGLGFLFIGIIIAIFGYGFSAINIENFQYINKEAWFLPYGVLLFAFAGLPAIPMQRRALEGKERQLKKSITLAVLVVGLLYLLFAVTVLGISGEVTSPDAISGLVPFLGPNVIWLGSLFGGLAVSTSFIMLGSALLEIFKLDFRIPRIGSWLLVVLPPYILFREGLRNFIDVISLAGSVAVGIEAVILILAYLQAVKTGDRTPEYRMKVPRVVLYLILAIFLVGVGYSLF